VPTQIKHFRLLQGARHFCGKRLSTLDSSKSFTPEADAWTFTPISSIATATNGEVMQKFVGDATKDATTVTKFEKQLFDPAGSDTTPSNG